MSCPHQQEQLALAVQQQRSVVPGAKTRAATFGPPPGERAHLAAWRRALLCPKSSPRDSNGCAALLRCWWLSLGRSSKGQCCAVRPWLALPWSIRVHSCGTERACGPGGMLLAAYMNGGCVDICGFLCHAAECWIPSVCQPLRQLPHNQLEFGGRTLLLRGCASRNRRAILRLQRADRRHAIELRADGKGLSPKRRAKSRCHTLNGSRRNNPR